MRHRPTLNVYLDTCAALGYSAGTLKRHRRMLGRFFDWCEDRSITDPRRVTRPMLERYRRYLYHARNAQGRALSLTGQRQHLTAVKVFFQWLTRENYLMHNPASELKLPRPHKRLPRAILTGEEVERVLKQTELHGEAGLRDRAMLETLYATGIRRLELTQLKLDDVDFDQHTLMVRQGKGQKDRLLPIGPSAVHWIGRYLTEVRPNLVIEPDRQILFLHDRGIAYTPHQLSDRVRDYLSRAGIDKPGSCHLFRHTMATLMLDHGADLRFIQAMLGHADISTTQIYTQVSIQKLRDVYLRTHPANLKTEDRGQTTDRPAEAALYQALEDEADAED